MSKQLRQQRALERLAAKIADDMASHRKITFSQRMEYNRLKAALGIEGKI